MVHPDFSFFNSGTWQLKTKQCYLATRN